MIRKLLIANRAEIASRVIRACRRMSVASVAVYSDADAHLPYVYEADEAHFIGPSPAAQSYLRQDVLIECARRVAADAVHPGYGFLSENAAFARAVRDAGFIFVGPTPEAMERLGGKAAAKAVAERAGVPTVPWFAVESMTQARREAKNLGYPVMVKPVSGGGGKGMYRCDEASQLDERIERAAREAAAAFGDPSLLVEKYLVNPRHIEVQILGDHHGNVLHLFERECSIQRRNQKLIEESPAPALTRGGRSRLCDAAVRVARAAGYSGAGTCEFLLDPASGAWYFCEMNTRLQVEHAVTEMVTGVDLVEWQLRVASGEKLGLKQSDVRSRGHAIEFRLISEDPYRNFTPSLGTIECFTVPDGDGVRFDAGYAVGDLVTPHYDSLLAKLIVHGKDRTEAMRRGADALRATLVVGVQTCIPFHLAMLEDAGFRAGDVHIHYAEARCAAGLMRREHEREAAVIATLMEAARAEKIRASVETPADMPGWSGRSRTAR